MRWDMAPTLVGLVRRVGRRLFGRLFRSDDFRNRKTELVVFVEAEIIHAGDGLARQLGARGQGAVRDFENKVRQEVPPPFPPQTPPPPAKGE